MPSRSKSQQRWAGAELARVREGKTPRRGLAEATLEDFASTPHKGLPEKVKPKAKKK